MPLRRHATKRMARTSPDKAAAIDLLDRLYFNQLQVHIVMRNREPYAFMALRRLTLKVQASVQQKGLQGARAANVKHWVYCILEIFLSDHIDMFKAHYEALPASEKNDGLDLETITRFLEHSRNFFAAMGIAVCHKTGTQGDGHIASDIAFSILDELRTEPACIRYRLSERALAMEFADAPLELYSWLSKLEIVPSAKFSGRREVFTHQEVVLRAASIASFESMRTYVASQVNAEDDLGVTSHLLGTLGKYVRRDLKEHVLDAAQAVQRRRMSPSKSHTFQAIPSDLNDPELVKIFFARCKALAPYMRACLSKQSTALTDIAAAMVAIRKRTASPLKALYVEEGHSDSIAHDVVSIMLEGGFKLNARTVHRHYVEALPAHIQSAERYHSFLCSAGYVLAAHYDDQFHYMQVTYER